MPLTANSQRAHREGSGGRLDLIGLNWGCEMRRSIVAFAVSLALAGTMAGFAGAESEGVLINTVSLSPSSQNHSHGQASNWTGNWSGGPAPYYYNLNRGNGTTQSGSTSQTSKGFSYTYFPCTTTTYYQRLSIRDADGDLGVSNQTQSTEQGGSPC